MLVYDLFWSNNKMGGICPETKYENQSQCDLTNNEYCNKTP